MVSFCWGVYLHGNQLTSLPVDVQSHTTVFGSWMCSEIKKWKKLSQKLLPFLKNRHIVTIIFGFELARFWLGLTWLLAPLPGLIKAFTRTASADFLSCLPKNAKTRIVVKVAAFEGMIVKGLFWVCSLFRMETFQNSNVHFEIHFTSRRN